MMNNIIAAYTIDQATADGCLFDIRAFNPKWKKGLFSHITTNLMSKGYMDKETDAINIPNLIDLLNQSFEIVRRKSHNFTEPDWFYTGKIELPSGEKQKIFIGQNELGRYTLMLPEDD